MTPNIIPSIFTAINGISGPVNAMGASIRRLGLTSQVTMARMEMSFARTSAAAMGLASSTTMLAAGILIPLGLATKAAVSFEKEMGNVGTLIDTTKESLSDMGDEVLKMSRKIPKSTHDLSVALYQIRSDGIKAGNGIDEAFGVLESSGKLAVAGLASTTEAAKTVTSAMNVFSDANLNSQQIANSMFKTVQGGKTTMSELGASFGKNAAIIHSAGVSLYEMNAATAAITATGITASQAQNELGAAVLAMMKPTGNLEQIFEKLGYSGEGGFKRLIESAGGLVPAMQKVNETAQSLGITMSEDFGRKEALVANILLTGDRYKAYMEELKKQRNGQDTLNGKFAEQSKTAAAQLELFHNSVNRLGISIGNLLIPAMNKMMDRLTPVIDGLTSFTKNHKTLVGSIVKGAAYFALFAASVGAIAFVVGTATKAFVLWKGAVYAFNFVLGFTQTKLGLLNGEILTNEAMTKGATVTIKGFNLALTRTLSLAIALYGVWKLFDKKDEQAEKMAAILPHLPEGVDKQKFSDQFQDILSPGHIPLIKRLQGVKPEYSKGLYDSLEQKYYAEPKRKQDSLMNLPMYMPEPDTTGGNAAGKVGQAAPLIQGSSSKVNIMLTVDNKAGLALNVGTAAGSNRAVTVQSKIVSTTSRNA